MTLAEQRKRLLKIIDDAPYTPEELLAAISAAGFSIIGPEVTEEMRIAANVWWNVDMLFKRMLADGDLAKLR
jgi:hypothetical protein